MNFEEKITKSIEANTNWSGSPDLLWEKIQAELSEKQPWWKNYPLWLGTVAAAAVILLLTAKPLLNPVPAPLPAAEQEPQFSTFAVRFMAEEPLEVTPGAEINIELTTFPAETGEATSPSLTIFNLANGEIILSDPVFPGSELLASKNLPISAPQDPGSYRLVVEGTVKRGEQLYTIWGEKTISVSE